MHTPRDPTAMAMAMAKNLRQALAEGRIGITDSNSLECVARQYGWRDWNTLAAQIDQPHLRIPEGCNISGSRNDDYEVSTPPVEAGGFSEQLRGNPPAYVLKAVSRPESPLMYDHRGCNVSVQSCAALAGVDSGCEGLRASNKTGFGALSGDGETAPSRWPVGRDRTAAAA